MSKHSSAKAPNVSPAIAQLLELSKLDTLYRDLHLQRARDLLRPHLSDSTYASLKESSASLPWLEQQLRASVERGEWERSQQFSQRIRSLKESLAAKSEAIRYGEVVYDGLADINIDPFSSGFHVFVGGSGETLEEWKNQALSILSSLQRTDPERKDFYARRHGDFTSLSITAPVAEAKADSKSDPAQLHQQALNALESGDLSQLDRLVEQLAKKVEEKPAASSAESVKLSEGPELGEDLLYTFSEATLEGARALGLTPVQTRSRRQFAHLVPHGWQPHFLKDDIRKHSKDQISRLTFPSDAGDKAREAIEFYLLNPFITSSGTRYHVCLVVEDLLLEDFAEPGPKEELPHTELLSLLRLEKRRGLSRLEIENALFEHGPGILRDKLKLDPEAFRLVPIPADIYTHLGPERGWGKQEMWTHFDGYRVSREGKLLALAGGDARFGGTHDVVSFSPTYSSDKIFARFAVVQRKRMKSWHQK